jgi:hypothetical protein
MEVVVVEPVANVPGRGLRVGAAIMAVGTS